jgi:predicted aspartyl protease
MRDTVTILALAILATALAVLLLSGSGGAVAGMDPDAFARLAALASIGILVGAALIGRGGTRPRLWHAAVWLAILVALMAGYRAFA